MLRLCVDGGGRRNKEKRGRGGVLLVMIMKEKGRVRVINLKFDFGEKKWAGVAKKCVKTENIKKKHR